MAKKSEIEAQIAALQKDLESADTDDEIWIKDESGREVKVTGRRATSVLSRFADLWDSDETAESEQSDGEKDTSSEKTDARPAGYFGRRK